jgi:hypothetical protein
MKKKATLLILIITVSFISNISITSAQEVPVGGGTTAPLVGGGTTKVQTIPKIDNPIKANNVQAFLAGLVDQAIKLGAILAVLVFIWIGFKFVIAQGDPGKIKEAQQWFLWAVIGTAILIGSKVILEVIKNTLIDSGLVNKGLF